MSDKIEIYTNATFIKGKLLVRGLTASNKRVSKEVNYQPMVWVDKNFNLHNWHRDVVSTEINKWKNAITKQPLIGVQFKDIRSCAKFVSDNIVYSKDENGDRKVVAEKVYTSPRNQFVSQYLSTFPDEMVVKMEHLRIFTLDIETEVGHRDVDDDTVVTVRNIIDESSMEKQKQETRKMTIGEYEMLPNRQRWELWDASRKEYVPYELHPYRYIGGFPEPTLANEKVTLITIKVLGQNQIHTWGMWDYKNTRDDVTYYKCETEEELLTSFLDFWSSDYPDAVTSWNGLSFDNTYLYNRIKKVLGQAEANRLSPWGVVNSKEAKMDKFGGDKKDVLTTFSGIADMDYLLLYKKFGTYSVQESYRLDYIAEQELGIKKIPNPTGGSFKDFYTGEFKVANKPSDDAHEIQKLGYIRTLMKQKIAENPDDIELKKKHDYLNKRIISMCKQLFVDYNIRDVELVDKLDGKKCLLDLCLTIAYSAKFNWDDVFSPVKTWDYIIYNKFLKDNLVIPIKKPSTKSEQFVGAYVKPPLIGKHEFCESFDLDSLYPHILIQYNISPETIARDKLGTPIKLDVLIDDLVHKRADTSEAHNRDYALTASGICFRRDERGVIPTLMEYFYGERKADKKKMLKAQSEHEKIVAVLRERGVSGFTH